MQCLNQSPSEIYRSIMKRYDLIFGACLAPNKRKLHKIMKKGCSLSEEGMLTSHFFYKVDLTPKFVCP